MVTTDSHSESPDEKSFHRLCKALSAALDQRRDELAEEWIRQRFAIGPFDTKLTMHKRKRLLRGWIDEVLRFLARYAEATDSNHDPMEAKNALLEIYRRVGERRATVEAKLDPDLSIASLLCLDIIWQKLLPELGIDETTYSLFTLSERLNRLMVELCMASSTAYINCQLEILKSQQAMIAKITNDLIEVEGRERRRLAIEIHDGPAQTLANLYNGIQLCERLIDIDLDRAKAEMANLKQIARDAVWEVRTTIAELRAPHASRGGITASLRDYLDNFEGLTGIRAGLKSEGVKITLSSVYQALLFKVVKEALTNVRKHGHAEMVEVRLANEGSHFSILVTDNGVGFDVESAMAESRKGRTLGLVGMQERVESLGGRLRIRSAPGRGTVLMIQMPKREEG